MAKTRKRVQVKSATIVGSSDYDRMRIKKVLLEENHRKNVGFFASIKEKPSTVKEPLPNTLVKVIICDKQLSIPYSVVKAAGYKWTL